MENLEEKAGGLEAGRVIGVSVSSSSAKLRSFLGVWCSGVFLGLAAAALVVLVDAEVGFDDSWGFLVIVLPDAAEVVSLSSPSSSSARRRKFLPLLLMLGGRGGGFYYPMNIFAYFFLDLLSADAQAAQALLFLVPNHYHFSLLVFLFYLTIFIYSNFLFD